MSLGLIKSFDFSGDPVRLLELFAGEPYPFLLDSSRRDLRQGRYSFIGFDPFEVFQGGGKDALVLFQQRFLKYREDERLSPTPLTCGAVGYLGYDYGLYQEKIRLRAKEELGLPECCFGFYDCILTVDHAGQKLYVTSCGLPERGESLRQRRAEERLRYILERLSLLEKTPPLSSGIGSPIDPGEADDAPGRSLAGRLVASRQEAASLVGLSSNFSREEYFGAVRKALGYIAQGDIYQVNLSQRFEMNPPLNNFDALETYKMLRSLSPSSFGGYWQGEDVGILSSSPERFLHVHNGLVQTRPMKGTRPRGRNPREDQSLRDDIERSPKDKAELLMITDLERNDLGKVCTYGSVHVREMRTVEEYPYVFQTTALIEGALSKDKDCFDVIRACFPGGSVTGCPKIRAMEIIEALEPTRRGPYTGSLGYIDFAGNMDLNILIRTLLHCGEEIYFQVGGGIVADSTPEGEYEETLVKARAMQACLERVRNHAKTCHLARR